MKQVLWKNSKEIPGNGIDDDKNGYVDDIYGWNFLGGADGRSVEQDSYEASRVYHQFKSKFADKTIDVSLLLLKKMLLNMKCGSVLKKKSLEKKLKQAASKLFL